MHVHFNVSVQSNRFALLDLAKLWKFILPENECLWQFAHTCMQTVKPFGVPGSGRRAKRKAQQCQEPPQPQRQPPSRVKYLSTLIRLQPKQTFARHISIWRKNTTQRF
jgi:hypothetical protein